MLKKFSTLAFILILTTTLTACGDQYRVEHEGMPEGLKTKLEQQVETGEEMLTAAEDDSAKEKALLEIAFANEQLGYFDKAIPFYKKILEINPNHFPALNNLGVIYEEVGEFETSAKYYGRLLEANPSNTAVFADAIKALLAAGKTENAQTNLENFARYNKDSEGIQGFISGQFELIRKARDGSIGH
jgi:tetratricopeptide (TPR) repeat protein